MPSIAAHMQGNREYGEKDMITCLQRQKRQSIPNTVIAKRDLSAAQRFASCWMQAFAYSGYRSACHLATRCPA